jgi:MSHA pilin protein MshA
MNKQSGFTLIELVAVLVILALLGAMAVPRFGSIQQDAIGAAVDGTENAIKSAHSIGIANLRRAPQVGELSNYVGGQTPVAPTAANDGIQFAINGDNWMVPTFTDATCLAGTGNATDPVLCVGNAVDIP